MGRNSSSLLNSEFIYVCPTENNYLSYYYNNELKELYESELDAQEWDLTCDYLDNNIKGILTSYLYSKDKCIYYIIFHIKILKNMK